MRYHLPKGMRYSTLSERFSFYHEEFNLEKVSEWLSRRRGYNIFATIIGRHTKIYPREFSHNFSRTIIIDDYQNLDEVKNLFLRLQPESVYYDRTLYSKPAKGIRSIVGQELAFDLDPENLQCPIHGSLKDKMARRQGLSFCILEFRMIKQKTIEMHERLDKIFSELSIVYSGRGFHIHIMDPETSVWSTRERKRFALQMKKDGFPIDEWVTTGGMRLIRLPYSLHGMVSRIAIPLTINKLQKFDPVRSNLCIPRFLRQT